MTFPMTPAQAAILGRNRPAPVATINAAAAGPSSPAPTGQTPVVAAPSPSTPIGFTPNGMGDMLLARAHRPGDIRTGVGLLGRLAALGVGNKINRENEAGAREETIAQLVALGMSPEQAALVAKGVIKPPESGSERKTFKDAKGRTRFQDTGELLPGEVGEGEPLDVLSEEAEAQKARIAEAGRSETNVKTEVKNLTGKAGEIESVNRAVEKGIVTPELGEKLISNISESTGDRARATDESKAAVAYERNLPRLLKAEEDITAAANALASNPTNIEARAAYEAAINNYANAKAKIDQPAEAVTNDALQAVKDTFPSAAAIGISDFMEQDPIGQILEVNRPEKPFELKDIKEMTDDELRELLK